MPVSAALPSILPAGSLIRLKQLEDQIAYKYSQDRIDQGLDQDGNDIDGYGQSDNDDDDDDNLDQSNTQWLLKQLAKLEETAPPEDEEEETLEEDQQQLSTHNPKTYFSSATTQTVETPQEQDYRRQHEQLTERVSSCLAHFCGRAASGAMTRTWTFRTTPPQSLQIHDPSFTEGDVGFKTFGSAYLLSKYVYCFCFCFSFLGFRFVGILYVGSGMGLSSLPSPVLSLSRVLFVLSPSAPFYLPNCNRLVRGCRSTNCTKERKRHQPPISRFDMHVLARDDSI